MEIEQKFEIEIEKTLNDKLVWFVNNYEQEIGGWLVGEIKENKIVIEDILFPEQEVSGASVDTSGKALIKLRKEYGDKCLKIIGHFHSHNTMRADWSSIDETFMSEFIEQRKIAVFIVSSKGDGHKIRVELNNPLRVSLDDLGYSVIYEDDELSNDLRQVIKDKVKERVFVKNDNWDNFMGYCGSRQTTLDNTKEVNEELGRRIKFYNKINEIEVIDVPDYFLEEVFSQFKELKPRQSEIAINGYSNITFSFKSKEEALKKMKELREFMRTAIETEIDLENEDKEDYNDYNRSYEREEVMGYNKKFGGRGGYYY